MSVLRRFMERLSPAATAGVASAPEAAEAPPPPVDFQKTMGRDQVTGLPNRACFAHVLNLQGQIAARLETRLSVLVVDWEAYSQAGLDRATRDHAMIAIATAVRAELLRTHDVLGSLGDGKLGAMLPFTDAAGADTVARKLQRAAEMALLQMAEAPDAADPPPDTDVEPAASFESSPHEAVLDDPAPMTRVNIGMASYTGKGPLGDDALLKSAEQAAVFAGLNGGDRVVRYDLAGPGAR